jgi:hypothetical protein
MYRSVDLGEVRCALDYRPAGCGLYLFGGTAAVMGGFVLALAVLAIAANTYQLGELVAVVLAGLVFFLPGLGICWSAWRRSRERVSYVFYDLALVRRAHAREHIFRWPDIAKITHVPSLNHMFVLETRSGERIEMSGSDLIGIGPDSAQLLTELTGVEVELIPARVTTKER